MIALKQRSSNISNSSSSRRKASSLSTIPVMRLFSSLSLRLHRSWTLPIDPDPPSSPILPTSWNHHISVTNSSIEFKQNQTTQSRVLTRSKLPLFPSERTSGQPPSLTKQCWSLPRSGKNSKRRMLAQRREMKGSSLNLSNFLPLARKHRLGRAALRGKDFWNQVMGTPRNR